jgi:TPR repeat protein
MAKPRAAVWISDRTDFGRSLGRVGWLHVLLVLLLTIGAATCLTTLAAADAVDEANQAVRMGDYEKAAKLLVRAAKRGEVDAQYQLASLYRSGRGVDKDHAAAARWFAAAAKQGHPKAQYNLGKMYQNGWGVDADRQRALHWYRLAAEQGHERARNELRSREGSREPAFGSAAAIVNIDPGQLASGEALRRAVRKDDRVLARTISSRGANVNQRDSHGRTVEFSCPSSHLLG